MTRFPERFGPFALLLLACVPLLGQAADPGPISQRLREEWKFDPFYQKQVDVGVLVVGSKLVTNNALAEAAWIVERMLGTRPDIIKAMRANKVCVAVMAAGEFTTDVPEHSQLRPKLYWDRRARGLGATLANPVVSCGEENLLGYPGDPYPKENIFVHEFAHAIHGTGLVKTDPMFDKNLRTAYQAARERGLWKNTYAATNHTEYWAEGVQCWFDDNAPPDALHNDIRTRAKLKEYDTELAKLCQEVFGDGDWRYTRPAARKAEDRKHLVGYYLQKLTRFEWRVEPLHDKAKATVQTSLGDFDVDLDVKGSPEAVATFYKIALNGGYHSGKFDRATHARDKPEIGYLSASVSLNWPDSAKHLKFPEIPASTIKPRDGALGLIRTGKNHGNLVVFLGDSQEPVPDIVLIGRIMKGMDVVRKMLTSEKDGTLAVDIRRVIRTE
ncbi:hypothetical protein BH11PLA2_BH11PLA2_44160 [soil metagenome]